MTRTVSQTAKSRVSHSHSQSVADVSDFGILHDRTSPPEYNLRHQLLEQERDNDRLREQITALNKQLSERPSLETIQALKREYQNLELLLQGSQRENEKCMAELDKGKARERLLEKELSSLVGDSWQTRLGTNFNFESQKARPLSSIFSPARVLAQPLEPSGKFEGEPSSDPSPSNEAAIVFLEQVRLLVLGMDERLQRREADLQKVLEDAKSKSNGL